MERKPSEKIELSLEDFKGIAVMFRVNGKEAGVFGWKPYRAEVTEFIRKGSNIIFIRA